MADFTIKLIYNGVVFSKKNSRQIIRTKSGAPKIISNAAAKANEEEMARNFEAQTNQIILADENLKFLKRPFNRVEAINDAKEHNERYTLSIRIYPANAIRRDLDNQLTTILDSLVKAGTLIDDSFQFVRGFDVRAVEIDRINPRAEIDIKIHRD